MSDRASGGCRPHDPYEAFRVPAFRRFLIGGQLAHIGAAAQGLAIGWEVYDRTGQALALGMVGLVQAIPMFAFTLPAGYLADVYDRRKIMIVSVAGTVATALGLAVSSYCRGPMAAMFVLLFLDASLARLGSPARTALAPLLVPPGVFESAVKWRSSLSQLSAMIGPAIGGFMIARSLPCAYLLSAATKALFVVVLCLTPVAGARSNRRGRMDRQLAEGLRFVWRERLVLGAISLDLFAVLLGGAVYLLPVFCRDIIRPLPFGLRPEQAMGWLRAAPAAGALCMALLLAHLPPMRRAGKALIWSVVGFGLATIVFGLSTSFWLSWGMLFLTGLFDNVSVVVRHTLVQLATPNDMRGRVSAVNSVFIGSSNQLGGLESGLVAHVFGPVISVVSGGIGTLLIVGTWAWLFPGLRQFRTFREFVRRRTAVDTGSGVP